MINTERLARIRGRLLASLAVAAVGCGAPTPQPTVNEPADHINQPPDVTKAVEPVEVPTGTHVNTPEDAPHVNTPAPPTAEPKSPPPPTPPKP